ncbi:MAG TPA: HDOD domain-containing protein [Phycisphaerae bacterium]|nr:HDOD domain-containing protein [Phycisphaerae bacterium]
MMHSETLETIKRSASLPSIPIIATRCYEMTQDPACNYDKLVELLSTDPGISAGVLRIANSPLFGATRQIVSLKQAIALLGVKRIRELVLVRYLVQKTEETACEKIDLNYYWRLSLTTAILSSKFAEALTPGKHDEAFMAGLLADVGVIVLAKALPKQYGPIADRYQPHSTEEWIESEYNLMGVSHGEVSALVLEQWNLPQTLVQAVKYHHANPADIPPRCQGALLARIINGSSSIARVLSQTSCAESAVDNCQAAIDRVQLDAGVLVRILGTIDEDIAKMAELLGVDVLNSRVFTLICKQLASNLENAVAMA